MHVIFGNIIAVMLVTGGLELHPGPKMERNVIDFVVEQREGMKGIHEWLQKDKPCMDTMSVKFDLMNDTTKILMEEPERIEGQVNSWGTKLRKMEIYKYMDERRRRNKVLILGIEECPQQSHFDTLKIREGVERKKLKVDNSSWCIDSVRRLGKNRGGRQILVRFISFKNKLKVLQATRNLAGTEIRIEQNYRSKVREIRRQLILI